MSNDEGMQKKMTVFFQKIVKNLSQIDLSRAITICETLKTNSTQTHLLDLQRVAERMQEALKAQQPELTLEEENAAIDKNARSKQAPSRPGEARKMRSILKKAACSPICYTKIPYTLH